MKTQENEITYLTSDQVEQLRTITEARAIIDMIAGRVGGVNAWAVVDLALSTGLRVSEMAALTIQDVDKKNNFLYVKRAKRKEKNKEILEICPKLSQHLKDYIAWADRETGPLFMGSRGPLSPQGLQRIWKAAVKRAGLPGIFSIHTARHSFAVRQLKTNRTLSQVMRTLGHTSLTTTKNIYSSVISDNSISSLNRITSIKAQASQQPQIHDEKKPLRDRITLCDACNSKVNGSGIKIDSGHIVCSECFSCFT